MKRLAICAVFVLVASAAFAQAPRVVNAAFEEKTVAGAFDPFFRSLVREQAGAAWIGYSVPAAPGHHAGCCGSGERFGTEACYLEGRPAGGATAGDDRPVRLEGDAALLVLFRVENGQVGRIALFSPDCALDAGGLRFVSLTGVPAADSVRLLVTFARTPGQSDRVARAALAALALHADASADEALIAMARNDASAAVRGQALFWLAQKAGAKAAGTIVDAIENDPEAQVKERAVFALSQLPRDQGVPLLINVARSNRDPRVRRRAMFWLGQSKDPRAIAFFEEVLKTR